MEIFYVTRKLLPLWPEPEGFDTHAVLEHRTLRDGVPLIVDEQMRPVEPICGWFRALAYENKQPETMRAYAYIVRRLAEFLHGRGTDVLGATEADLVGYRWARTELDARPVDGATWDKEAVVINSFYNFLLGPGVDRAATVSADRSESKPKFIAQWHAQRHGNPAHDRRAVSVLPGRGLRWPASGRECGRFVPRLGSPPRASRP